jgi:selenocysteine lyase/cysteine desulfurase
VGVRPKENGVLYINKSAQSKIWASIFSAYPDASASHARRRIRPARRAYDDRVREALTFQVKIGRAQIEKRSRELTQALLKGLKTIDGVKIWTSPIRRSASRSSRSSPGTRHPQAVDGALQRSTSAAQRAGTGPSRHPPVAALLQHARRHRPHRRRDQAIHGHRV